MKMTFTDFINEILSKLNLLTLNDFVSYSNMPLEQRVRTERLLFNFSEPFDKEKAHKQFKCSDKSRPSPDKLVYYQKLLLEQIVATLDTYAKLYTKHGETFIQLLPIIEKPYYFVNLSLKDIECHPDFPFKVLYAKYDSYLLYLNSIAKTPKKIVKNWEEQRSNVIDLIASIKNHLFNNPYIEEKRPQLFDDLVTSLQTALNEIKGNFTEQKSHEMNRQKDIEITPLPDTFKQDDTDTLLFYLGNFGTIRMGSVHSSPTIILKMQITAKGNLVPIRKMLDEINETRKNTRRPFLVVDDVRRKVSQLNIRLAKETHRQVEIRESGLGSYHLWHNSKK